MIIVSGFKLLTNKSYQADIMLEEGFVWSDFPKTEDLNLLATRGILYSEDYETNFNNIRLVNYERNLLSGEFYAGVEGIVDEVFFVQNYSQYGIRLKLDVFFPETDDYEVVSVSEKLDIVKTTDFAMPDITAQVIKGYDFKENRPLTAEECFELSGKLMYDKDWQEKLANIFLSGIRLDGGRELDGE